MSFRKFLKKKNLVDRLQIEKIILEKSIKVHPRLYKVGKIVISTPGTDKSWLQFQLESVNTAIRRVKAL